MTTELRAALPPEAAAPTALSEQDKAHLGLVLKTLQALTADSDAEALPLFEAHRAELALLLGDAHLPLQEALANFDFEAATNLLLQARQD